jgi:hypothetical protein
MTLQDAEPQATTGAEPTDVAPETPPAPVPAEGREPLPGDGLLDPVAEESLLLAAPGPVCRACGTAIGDGQDWCLECGTAVEPPRRLPGLRALAIAGVLTLGLSGGAVAASYAALNQDTPPQETKVETVAQTTPLPTTETTPTDVEPLPTVDSPPPATDVTPITPAPSVTPSPPTSTSAPTTGQQTTTTTTTTTTEPEGPKRIVVPASAGSLYDPAKRATAAGDPKKALDGNLDTSWFVTTPPGGDMNVGYLIDLGDPEALTQIDIFLKPKTPSAAGFTAQVFGASGKTAPEAADSAKWTELGKAGSIDGDAPDGSAGSVPPLADGKDKTGDGRVNLPLKGEVGATYRWVLVWFTTPPAGGPTVRINEFKLYG